MKLFDKVKAGVSEGLDSSRDVLKAAKAKTHELEEAAIIRLDLKRLEARTDRLVQDLGVKAYSVFVEEKRKSLSVKTPGVKEILQQLEGLQVLREEKESKLKQRG